MDQDQVGYGEGDAQTDLPGCAAPTLLEQCTDRLPADRLTADIVFTRFIKPQLVVGARGGRRPSTVPAVLPRTAIDPMAAAARVAGRPDATWLDAQGGLAPFPAWNVGDLNAPVAVTSDVADIGQVLAERTVDAAGELLNVHLDTDDIRGLLAGEPRLVRSTAAPSEEDGDSGQTDNSQGEETQQLPDRPSLVWLRPPPPQQSDVVVIDDLPTFLANPRLTYGPNIDLAREQIQGLLNAGRASIEVAGRTVDLVHNPGRAPDAIASSEVPLSQRISADVLSTSGDPGQQQTIEFAISLQWHQRWQLNGYRRGALLSTVSLAPQEQTTIEIFSWNRRKTESEMTSSVESQDNLDTSDTTRDTTDVLNETKNSSSMTWSAQGGLTLPIMTGASLMLGGSAQDRQTMDGISRSTNNHVHEQVIKAATTLRQSRQTKVSETVEIGSEQRVTRTITNPNMCRVLNLDCFEVVSQYSVSTFFDRAATRACLLIPSPLTPSFTRLTVRTHESTLRRALLERSLDDAFDAVRLLAARARACAVACETCTCDGSASSPQLQLPEYTQDSMRFIGSAWYSLVQARALAPPNPSPSIDERVRARFERYRRWVYRLAVDAIAPQVANVAWEILGATIGVNTRPLTSQDAYRLWWAVTSAGGVEALRPSKLAAERMQFLDDIVFDVIFAIGLSNIEGYQRAGFFSHVLRGALDDSGLTAHLDRFMASFTAQPAAAAAQAAVTAASTPNPAQAARDTSIRDAFPMRDTAVALEREEALLQHLSDNASHYWLAMWQALSTSQQATLLSKALPANIVDPWPIGMVDYRLAFPVTATVPGVQEFLDGLFGDQDPESQEADVTLPTPAVTMEARLGACDGCEEFIRQTRAVDIRTRTAAARRDEAIAAQEQTEAARRQARLDQTPPMLGDPHNPQPAPRLDVHVTTEPGAAPPSP